MITGNAKRPNPGQGNPAKRAKVGRKRFQAVVRIVFADHVQRIVISYSVKRVALERDTLLWK